jgi:hypothetical protein
MSKLQESSSASSTQEAFARLQWAYRGTDRGQRAEAHLNVVSALASSIEMAGERANLVSLYEMMLEHAERSLADYSEAEIDWGLADARLARAAVLADLVTMDEEYPGRHERILQCVDDCFKALELLHESPHAPLTMLAQANAMAAAILLQLKQGLAGMELPPSLDEWIMAQSESTGESIAWETRLRSEGNDWLCLARVSASLTESLPEAGDRESTSRIASEAAWQAAECLRLTGDQQATQAAWSLQGPARPAARPES